MRYDAWICIDAFGCLVRHRPFIPAILYFSYPLGSVLRRLLMA